MNRFFFRFAGLVWLVMYIGACQSDLNTTQTVIHTLSKNGSYPTSALNQSGDVAYVVWMEEVDGEPGIYFTSSMPDGSFKQPVIVNHLPGDAATGSQAPPLVAAGPNDEIYVVWQVQKDVEGRRFPASNLRLSSSKDGGKTFSPAIFVNDDAKEFPTGHTFHSLAVGPDGTIYVAWIDSRLRDAARREAAAKGKKTSAQKTPDPEIRVARSSDGGRSFEKSVVVDREACPCCKTAIAIGGNGNIYISYRKVFSGNIRDIVVAQSTDDGNTFLDPVRVAADNWEFEGCPHNGPYLVVDESEQLHVTWFTGKAGFAGNYYATGSSDLVFNGSRRLAPAAQINPLRSSVSVKQHAGPLFVCEAPQDSGSALFLTSLEAGNFRIIEELGQGAYPSHATRGNHLIVTWLDNQEVKAYRRSAGNQVAELGQLNFYQNDNLN